METPHNNTIKQTPSFPVICPLCLTLLAIEQLHEHLQIHERAEMLADILALSRR
ncbi:MAG: hypothetical protein ABIO57_01200 [Candidatus Paceibacterota bacterium]